MQEIILFKYTGCLKTIKVIVQTTLFINTILLYKIIDNYNTIQRKTIVTEK